MVKKLKGDSFFLSANDLKSGSCCLFDGDDWSSKIEKAKKLIVVKLKIRNYCKKV